MKNDLQSGAHLGAVRNWIKWKARNGSHVTWESRDQLQIDCLTVCELEALAQKIKNALSNENKHKIERVKNTLKILENAEGIEAFKFDIMRCIETLESL